MATDIAKIIESMLAEKGPLVLREMESVLPRDGIPNLYDAIWYHLETGGKRLRPVLAIVTCEALGCDSKKILPFAAACELLHNWLLVHDDVEDGDTVRRDKPAVWVKYGLGHGVNIGDMMAQKVFELILNSQKKGVDEKTVFRLVKVMTNTAVRTSEGQAMDMNMRKSDSPTEKEYMEMVTLKTGYYFTVPMVGGAIVAKAGDDVVKKIIDFGRLVGPAFQISDDLLDLTEGKGRGEIGADIKEGKRSILVVHAAAKAGAAEKKKLFEILNKPREKTTKEDVLWVKRLFEKHQSIKYARQKADELVKKSRAITKTLKPELREILDYFADYVIKRKK